MIPRSTNAGIAGEAQAKAGGGGADVSGRRVLIVEDEPLVAFYLADIVEDCGCEVVGPAATCGSALDLLGTQEVDAAILDLILSDGNCDAVADALTARGIPWALATGFDVLALHPRYQTVPILRKPCPEGDVARMIETLLGLPAA